MRDLIKPLWVKKEIRRRLTARRSSRSHIIPISKLQSLKYTISMQWYKVLAEVVEGTPAMAQCISVNKEALT